MQRGLSDQRVALQTPDWANPTARPARDGDIPAKRYFNVAAQREVRSRPLRALREAGSPARRTTEAFARRRAVHR